MEIKGSSLRVYQEASSCNELQGFLIVDDHPTDKAKRVTHFLNVDKSFLFVLYAALFL
jgi:hypothetical protein